MSARGVTSAHVRFQTIGAIALAVAVCALFAFLSTRSSLWDRDEPRFAQATVEMIDSGDYLVPKFNHALRPDKPILVYWLMSIPVRLFGAQAWSVRLWSAIAAGVSVFATWRIARSFFGARTALLAAAMLASSPLFVMEGTAATTDAILLACTTSAVALYAEALAHGRRRFHVVGFIVALALAQLAKGPVGLVLPLLAVFGARWLERKRSDARPWPLTILALSALASFALFCAWAVPANIATGGELYARAVGHHIVDRIASPMEHHGGGFFVSLPYYLPVVLVGFAPWTMYLPAAIARLAEGESSRARALLLAWIATCFALMALVATKLPHYVLPMWPALAIAAASTVAAAARGELTSRARAWCARGAWLFVALVAAGIALLVAAPVRAHLPTLVAPCALVALVLGSTGACALWTMRRERHMATAALLFSGAWLAYLTTGLFVLPAMERLKPVPSLAAAIRARTDASVPIATYGFGEPSLDFYVGRPPIRELADLDQARAWAAENTPGVLVTTRARRLSLGAGQPSDPLQEFAAVAGFDFGKGRPIELVALGRALPARDTATVR